MWLENAIRLMLERRAISPTGCWEYTGPLISKGYGYVSIDGLDGYTHRLSVQYYHGHEFKDGDVVAHKCDNMKCFNPEHLFVTDVAGNNRDMFAKGRGYVFEKDTSPTCPNGHLRTPENVYEHEGRKRCCECRAEANRKYKAKKKIEHPFVRSTNPAAVAKQKSRDAAKERAREIRELMERARTAKVEQNE